MWRQSFLLSLPCHFRFVSPPHTSSGLVPIFLLLILALSSHPQFHFPQGAGGLFPSPNSTLYFQELQVPFLFAVLVSCPLAPLRTPGRVRPASGCFPVVAATRPPGDSSLLGAPWLVQEEVHRKGFWKNRNKIEFCCVSCLGSLKSHQALCYL